MMSPCETCLPQLAVPTSVLMRTPHFAGSRMTSEKEACCVWLHLRRARLTSPCPCEAYAATLPRGEQLGKADVNQPPRAALSRQHYLPVTRAHLCRSLRSANPSVMVMQVHH